MIMGVSLDSDGHIDVYVQYGGIIASVEYYKPCPNFGGAILSCCWEYYNILSHNSKIGNNGTYITGQQIKLFFFHPKLSQLFIFDNAD